MFDWAWAFAHSRHEPLSEDDRKRMWKAAIAAIATVSIVLFAKEGVLIALGLKVSPLLDGIASAIIVGAGADKFSQFSDFVEKHEPAPIPSQSVHVVTTDELTYAVTGEMTVLNK
jgi:hypothetical protein